MAKIREPEKPIHSETESIDEEDEFSSEGDGSSDSEPEQNKSLSLQKPLPALTAAPKKSLPPTTSKPHQPASSFDDEDSGSESDSEGPKSEVTPRISKPMDSPQKSVAFGKLRSKPTTDSSTPAKPTRAKRSAEGKQIEAEDIKRSKKKPEPQTEISVKKSTFSGDQSKKRLTHRLWSEEDEIVILKGMAEYAAKRPDSLFDLYGFYDFIKKDLFVEVTRGQLYDKIRRLKKKYEINKGKETEGIDNTFSGPHERKTFGLSKIVWETKKGKETVVEKVVGSPKANGNAARKNSGRMVNVVEDGNSKGVGSLENADGDLSIFGSKRLIPNHETAEERILRLGTEFFEGDKKLKGASEWRKLRREEVELHLKKLDLLRAQTKLILKSTYQ